MLKTVINIMFTRQNVNMGDHAETIWQAVAPLAGETVEELVERALTEEAWRGDGKKVIPAASLTIRIAEMPDPEAPKHDEGLL